MAPSSAWTVAARKTPPRENLGVITGRGMTNGLFPDAPPDSPATPII